MKFTVLKQKHVTDKKHWQDKIVALRDLWRDRAGVTALEYGIIAGVLGISLVGIFTRLASTMSTIFSHIDASI